MPHWKGTEANQHRRIHWLTFCLLDMAPLQRDHCPVNTENLPSLSILQKPIGKIVDWSCLGCDDVSAVAHNS